MSLWVGRLGSSTGPIRPDGSTPETGKHGSNGGARDRGSVNLTAPLLVTDDDALLADLVRLAAAAGVVPMNARDVSGALRSWATAPIVLVGADLAEPLAQAQPVRRSQVHIVGADPLPASLYRAGIDCGAESVFSVSEAESSLVELLTDTGDGSVATAVTIGVVGGAGGSGATVFAAALAQAISLRSSALVVDVDPLGAGIDRILGLEAVPGSRWDALVGATGRLSARSLREALPRRDGLSVLTWPTDRMTDLPAFAVREALSAGQRGFPAVVLDLPRQRDPVVDDVVARCDHVVLVSTLTVPAVASASRMVRRLPTHATRLVVRGSGPAAHEVERLLGVPVLAAMSNQHRLDEAINLGMGPLRSRRGPLARAARRVVDALLGGAE